MKNIILPQSYKILAIKILSKMDSVFSIQYNNVETLKIGQFAKICIPQKGEVYAPITYIDLINKEIGLFIRKIGNVTDTLFELKVGDSLYLKLPDGEAFPLEQLEKKDILIIIEDIAIARAKGLIDYIVKNRDKFYKVNLILNFRNECSILFKEAIEEWKQNLEITVHFKKPQEFIDELKGYVSKANEPACNKTVKVIAMLPEFTTNEVRRFLEDKGINERNLFIY